MKPVRSILNLAVAALLPLFLAWPLWAEDVAKLDQLFADLKTAEKGAAERIEREIWNEWSKSGSPAMDLLLQRGREAMAAGEHQQAIEHLTALIDHAPDFAEGWNARATAYYSAGEFGPSIADIAQTLALNPRHFGALAGLGAILESLEQPEKALKAYRAVKDLNPHASGITEAIERLEKETAGTDL